MFSQVGEFASSKSAMKPLAPELSALITILRSVGPVISTRRFCSLGGAGATCQSPSRISWVSGRKSSSSPAAKRTRRSARRASSSRRRSSKRLWSSATKARASSVRTCSKPSWIGAWIATPVLTAEDHTCTRSGHYANMCSIMVVCVLLKRLSLIAALGGARRELIGEPVALAPEPGREQRVGDVSPAAEAFGIAAGMRVGEALARCPDLRLLPADPEATRGYWNAVLDRLESLGTAVESDDPGVAYFETRGVERLHGGHVEGVLAAVRRVLPASIRLGVAPSRFAAYAAAVHTRPRRTSKTGSGSVFKNGIVPEGAVRAFLAPLPVGLLRPRPGLEDLPEMLERLGIRTLGELAGLPPSAVAERFGHPGLLALELAQGRDTRLEPRRPQEPLFERLALPEAASGPQLERALEMVIARLLARRERRGRSLRVVALSARFVEGGTWRVSLPDRKSTRLNSSHPSISYAVFCLKKKKQPNSRTRT